MGLFHFKKKKEVISETFEEDLIRFLNEKNYKSTPVQLLLPESVSLLNMDSEWKPILSLSSRKERIKKTIEYWEKYAKEFEIVIQVFKKCLVSIDTVLYDKKLTVIYTFHTKDGLLYYIGYLSQVSYENTIINKLPKPVKDFYEKIHDGFVVCFLEDMGLTPSSNIYCLGDDLIQDEFLEDYSVKDTYMIFENGGGDGIVYDVSKNPPKGFLYWHDDLDNCDFEEDPIKIMCSWMEIAIVEN